MFSLWSVAFGPDGKHVATASDDGAARISESATGKEVSRLEHDGAVNAVAFSPDGKYVATASLGDTARVWEAATGEEVSRLKHDDDVHDVVFSPDGKYVATSGRLFLSCISANVV